MIVLKPTGWDISRFCKHRESARPWSARTPNAAGAPGLGAGGSWFNA